MIMPDLTEICRVIILKKRFLLVLASVTLVIGCSYFLTGKVIQKNYYETVARINTKPNIKVTLLNYKRGLIHSTADLEVAVGANNPATSQIIPLRQVITHGPVIALSTPNGYRVKILAGQIKSSLGADMQKMLQDATNSKHPLTITTIVDFSDQATTWLNLTAIDQSTETEFHVQWAAITGEIKHDLNFANYKGNIKLPMLEMHKPSWQFKVSDLALILDTSRQENSYLSSNILSAKSINYSKQGVELIKLQDVSTTLAFANKADNLTLDLIANVASSQIVNQQFTNDTIKLQANYINRDTLEHLPRISALSPKATIDLMQELTVNSTELTFELPKHFTEALLSYVSFEMYRASPLGKYDRRPEQTVLQDISSSINKLVSGAVKQRLFLDKGDYYALNFNRGIAPEVNQG
jgi:uncharacterized protein YdgA (DUF945 family)